MPPKHRQLDSPVPQQPRIKRQELSTPKALYQQPTIHPLDADTSETWAVCAKCALTIGHLELAFTSCQKAIEKNRANVLALCTISATYREDDFKNKSLRGTENALALLNDALRIFPSLGNELSILKEIAECQYGLRYYDQAHATLERILQTYDNDPEVWLLEGKALIRMGGRVGTKNMAVNALRNALSRVLKPLTFEGADVSRSCHSELAAIAFSEGKTDVALAELNNTLALFYPSETQKFELSCTWCALAISRESNGDIQGALQICETAEKSLGSYPRMYLTEAYLLLIQPTYESAVKAIALLKNVTEKPDHLYPELRDDFLAWYLMGTAYATIDEPSLAYESFHIALAKAPTSAFPWLSVGSLYLKLNQLRDSLAAYSKAAKLKEDIVGYATSVVTWKGLACVYERCDKQFSDAANACDRAAGFARLAGDFRTNTQLEQRSHALLAASRGEAPIPKLQAPPDPPLQLLRELVLMTPEERVEYISSQNIKQQQLESQQTQPQPQPPATQAPPQPQPQQAPSQVPQQPLAQAQPMHQQSSVHFHPGLPPQGPPQQFSPRQQVAYQQQPQQFSPRSQVAYQQQQPQPQSQQPYQLAPINREGQSTPLPRPNVTLPSPTSALQANGGQPQYHYAQQRSIPPISHPQQQQQQQQAAAAAAANAHAAHAHAAAAGAVTAGPQIRPGGHYSQFPHPADQRPREYL